MRRALALDRRAQRQDDFRHSGVAGALHQRIDGQVIRSDTIERRQDSAEHVIARIDGVCPLERPKIGDVRHDHDRRCIASRIGAQRARILRVDIAAAAAH